MIATRFQSKDINSGPSEPVSISVKIAENATGVKPQKKESKTFYIDYTNGNNGNSGTKIDKAWKDFSNIKKVSFSGGDAILLKRGEIWNQPLVSPPGGSENKSILIDAYGSGNLPVIDVKNAASAAVRIYHSYISINNLRVQNSTNTGITIGVPGGLKNIKLKNIKVFNAGNNGIGVSHGGSNFEIIGCYIKNTHNNGIYLGGSADNKLSHVTVSDCHITKVFANDGITIHEDGNGNTAGSGFLLKNNVSEMCAEQGFDITTGKNILLLNNRSYMNKQGGVIVGHSAQNITIKEHTSSDEPVENTSAAINLGGSFGNIRLLKSIIKGNGYHLLSIRTNNVAIFNNNFIWNGGGAPIDISGKIENIHFINNIVTSKQNKMSRIRFLEASRPPDYKSFHFDNNLYYIPDNPVIFYHNERNYDFKAYKKAFKVEKHSLNINPEFREPRGDEYQLKKNSPAIDTGRFYSHPLSQGTGKKLQVKHALFFYNNLNSNEYQCIMFKGINGKFKIIDVNYKNNTISIDQDIDYVPSSAIGFCFNQVSLDIGRYEFDNLAQSSDN